VARAARAAGGAVIDLARTIDLPVGPEQAWTALWDVPAVARCLPGLQNVEEIPPSGITRRDEPHHRYRVTVKDKVGPFSVAVTLDVTVDPSEAERLLRVSATGRDSVLGSPVRMSMTACLTPRAAGGSHLVLDGHAEVGGKLAALGQAVIHRKTREVLDTFARNLGAMLATRG
jgi:carbon monoxide dehydrogenase subunit G